MKVILSIAVGLMLMEFWERDSELFKKLIYALLIGLFVRSFFSSKR